MFFQLFRSNNWCSNDCFSFSPYKIRKKHTLLWLCLILGIQRTRFSQNWTVASHSNNKQATTTQQEERGESRQHNECIKIYIIIKKNGAGIIRYLYEYYELVQQWLTNGLNGFWKLISGLQVARRVVGVLINSGDNRRGTIWTNKILPQLKSDV